MVREVDKLKKEISKHKAEISKHKTVVREHKKKNEELKKEKRALRKHLKKHADVYVLEMKKALSTAILAAFAFLMALSWREYISEVISSFLIYSPVQGKLISALFVTIISVIGIIVVTRALSVKEK